MSPHPARSDAFNCSTKLQSAAWALQSGQPEKAIPILREVVTRWPSSTHARRLLGLAFRDIGDLLNAETELRAALALEPCAGQAAVPLSEILLATQRAQEAEQIMAPLAISADADLNILTAHGEAQKALGRLTEALQTFQRAVRVAPSSAVAEHNLASILGDLEHFTDSEAAATRALAKGLATAETWLVRGRARIGRQHFDPAEADLREAIARRPDYADAHAALAQLLWMRTADVNLALEPMNAVLRTNPNISDLALRKSELLDYAGYNEGAYAALSRFVSTPSGDPILHVAASRLKAKGDPEKALWHAAIAARAMPNDYIAQSALCETWLAIGDAERATRLAEALHERMPSNQHALALLSTSWRLLGDPRYDVICDFSSQVWLGRLETPLGWATLEAFLSDLTASLGNLHGFNTHPIGQSLRHGSQTTQSLTLSSDPVIQAFFTAVDAPIRARIATLSEEGHPVSSRKTGCYAFTGAWSVRLRPNGFHANHVHPMGWLSSACYVSVPGAVDRAQEGWLKFGEAGVPTRPALGPQHFVKPEPGLVALFPSYMWHGTIPFSGDQPRLTIAFDIVPDRGSRTV